MKKILATMMVLVLAMGMVFAEVKGTANGLTSTADLTFSLSYSLTEAGLVGFAKTTDPTDLFTSDWAKTQKKSQTAMTIPSVTDATAITLSPTSSTDQDTEIYLYGAYRGTKTTPQVKLAATPLYNSESTTGDDYIPYKVVVTSGTLGSASANTYNVTNSTTNNLETAQGIITMADVDPTVAGIKAGACKLTVTVNLKNQLDAGTLKTEGTYSTTLTASLVAQ